ncbi:MAG: F0F1 ATP synthase subunit alpha [Trueperaceae bacterium]
MTDRDDHIDDTRASSGSDSAAERNAAPAGDVAKAVLAGLGKLDAARLRVTSELAVEELGVVESVASGVALVTGLPGVAVDEVVRFESGQLGLATDLGADQVGITLLADPEGIRAGSTVVRTGSVLSVPVGPALLGRIVDPLGFALDDQGPVASSERLPVERPATPIFERAPVTRPLHTGIKAIDALFPIGRGQRELIIGDRQTGKSSVALSAVLAQRHTGVKCVYCSIGQRGAQVARTVETLKQSGALEYTTVVVAASHEQPGVRQIAPFAATSMAEALMEAGHDVLVVYDDLSQHALAYRELSLLLRRPPGREAYPGDVFYLHARLLERATQLSAQRGGGSLTSLPIVEIQERDLSSYIPTNLISITDGQIVLNPDLFSRGVLPAVHIGLSVSRVGGKAQLPALHSVAGRLRLAYAQFEELERFARFGADVDEATRTTLTRGRRIRSALAQGALQTVPAGDQVALLLAVSEGLFDNVDQADFGRLEARLMQAVHAEHGPAVRRLEEGAALEDADRDALLATARDVIGRGTDAGAGPG